METKKTPVSVGSFEEGLKEASPMPLYANQKKEKTSYDYFLELGDAFSESLKNGTSPFLPNKDGMVDLTPAYNINKNTKAEGLAQIMLLTKAAELGAQDKGFVTFETVKNAQEEGVECKIAKGSKGTVIPVVDEKDWSQIKFKNTWFNISQVENGEKLVEWCKERMTEQYKEDVQYINEHYPNSTYKEKLNPAEKNMARPNEKTMPLNENTKEAYQYLAQVLNAVNSGRKLYVTPEQAENFKVNAVKLLEAEYQPGKRDVLAIKKLCNSAEHLYQKNKKRLQEYSQKQQQEAKQEKSAAKKPRSREQNFERGM